MTKRMKTREMWMLVEIANGKPACQPKFTRKMAKDRMAMLADTTCPPLRIARVEVRELKPKAKHGKRKGKK